MKEMRFDKAAALIAGVLLLGTSLAVPAAAQQQGVQAEPQGQAAAPADTAHKRPPALDRQFHRALTAWRTQSSLLEAKARLDRVLQELPDDTEARKLRAEVLLEMNRPKEALQDAKRTAELHPEDGEAHLLYAEAARESGRLEVARRALDTAAKHLAEDAALHTRFSWNAMLLERPAQAEAFGRVALALDSTSASAYRQLARVFLEQERPDEAAAVLARGLRGAVLQPRSIREDDRLRRLTDHPRLEGLMRE